jgi:hypothetical protein
MKAKEIESSINAINNAEHSFIGELNKFLAGFTVPNGQATNNNDGTYSLDVFDIKFKLSVKKYPASWKIIIETSNESYNESFEDDVIITFNNGDAQFCIGESGMYEPLNKLIEDYLGYILSDSGNH